MNVVDVVKRTPQGEHLEFIMSAAPDVTACIDEVDLAEILGNLIENASRFARSRIVIKASDSAMMTTIAIEDDGPGIPEEARMRAMARGERLDLSSDGAGLGLAIVADVVEAYAGTLTLEDASPGLRTVVTLPSSQRRPPRQTESLLRV